MYQRFGSGSVPTHLIGAALLRGEWKSAANLILDPREGDILKIHSLYLKTHIAKMLLLLNILFLHNLILFKQRAIIREARVSYKEHGDIDLTLKKLPRHLVAERAIVRLFYKI